VSGGSAGNAWLLGVIAGLATENAVFTDHIGEADVVGDFMPNLPFPVGAKLTAACEPSWTEGTFRPPRSTIGPGRKRRSRVLPRAGAVCTLTRIDDTHRRYASKRGGPVAFTSKDVARAAGVSQSTVSYVMSGKRPISPETRDRVLAAMEKLTYQPNAGARALAGRRTSVIGLVIPFRKNAEVVGLLPFIQTIAEVARAHDHEVLLVTSDEGSAGLKRLAGRSLCDAIVLMDVQADDERVPVAAALGVPVVLVGIPDEPAGLHCVDVDFAQAARTAVEELAQTGHDRLTIIDYPADVRQRRLNFVHRYMDSAWETARRLALPLDILALPDPGRVGAAVVVEQLLAGQRGERHGLLIPEPEAIRPVLHALEVRGVVPGRDISVIGHCTDVGAEESEPAVTNVSLEPRSVSQQAMATLFWLLDPVPGVPPEQIALVPTRLTRRSTTVPT
jgi:DNA-binding LacI/PurR family transcriptional regulator